MKRLFTSTCLAVFCAAGLGAQTQADDQKQKAADQAKAQEKTVTITGCLRAGDTPNSFVLANVKTAEPKSSSDPDAPASPPMPPTPPTPPTNPPSTPPTDPPSTPPTPPTPPDPAPSNPEAVGTSGPGDVRLIDTGAKLDLAKHVGHTVTLTGTFVPPAKGKPTGTSGTASAAADARSFNVKSMTHISETCK